MTINPEDSMGSRIFPTSQCKEMACLLPEIKSAFCSGDGLYLVYQPKVSLQTGSTIGAEALIRWEHPQCGLIMPDKILPLVEEGGLRIELTRWVIQSALSKLQEWQHKGIVVPVSINVSAKDVAHSEFCEALESQIYNFGVSPSLLGLECLETENFLNNPAAISVLERLKLKGVNVLLDDFGAGYSGTECLTALPLDTVKLDRSIITGILVSRECKDRLRQVIRVIKTHGYQVIAEGVEDPATLSILRDMGCDAAQGYVYSAPLLSENFERWLLEPRDKQN